MRTLLLLAFFAFVGVVHGQPAPFFPATTSQSGTDAVCQLSDLALNGGVSILPDFTSSRFEYQCSCADWDNVSRFGPGSPQVLLKLLDKNSNAQVWFNGVAVNTEAKGNAIKNKGSHPIASLPLATESNPWIDGENRIQILTHCTKPHNCEYQYVIKCVIPVPVTPPFVVGDPQIIGLRGQIFQVHGVAGSVYNIVSDPELQYNSRFVFLDQGECPVVDGRRQKGCWSHPGSYLGELGLKTKAGDRIHVVTGSAQEGFRKIEVNEVALSIGDSLVLAGDMGSITYNTTHLVSVQIGNWDFSFENSDHFVNQRVQVFDSSDLRSHGLLGQTWKDKTYNNPIKHIEGHVDDYAIRNRDLFGDEFMYNAFV